MNNDGYLDALIGNTGENAVWINNGSGVFLPDLVTMPGDTWTTDFACADFDLDGDIDLVCANRGSNQLLANIGNGFVEAAAGLFPTDNDDTSSVELFDFEGDGDLDIAFGADAFGASAPFLRVYRNDGLAGFHDVQVHGDVRLDWSVVSLTSADLEGDGDVDLVSTGPNGVQVMLNPSRKHLQAPLVARAGRSYTVQVVGGASPPTTWLLSLGALPAPVATPFGLFRLDPITTVALPTPGSFLSVTIPSNTTLVGVDLHWQALLAPVSLPQPELTDMIVDRVQ